MKKTALVQADSSNGNKGKNAKVRERRSPGSAKRELTANEATLRAWKKTHENRHRKGAADQG